MTNEENSKPRNGDPKNGSGQNGAQPAHDHESAPDHAPVSGRGTLLTVGVLLVVVAVLAVYGIWKRHRTSEVLADTTNELASPTVIALPAKPGAPVDSFVLPGNVTAFSDSPIFARTSGYLKKWYYDIGAPVKQGALLAEISTPELDQQLAQTEADLVTAQTNAGNAHTQAERYKGLVTSDAVSQFDTDTFVTQEAATSSAVKSAQATVQRLKELQSFEKVYAPFDGVVTARSVDVGQLITEGSTAELFHVQAVNTLRVYTNVPQVYTQGIKKGEKIDLTFPEHPGKTFQGTLVRTADAIDPTNRTLLVEVDVDNRKGELTSGSLAQVHLKTPAQGQTFILPASALIFRHEGLRVGTVVNGNVARLVPVTIGEDDGATVQVIAGIKAEDKIIQDPPDSLIDGESVRVQSLPNQNSSNQSSPNQKGGGK
ncbi:efflux RND transporter periplasmic adaptor subunit [Terracidiphilus gabretensis]|uniref:efflux RND transporter periplasmic adaptor subunit n=1 Tax=Terracidiphilus gabretensis TaxID=1577687 RepID=UPI0009E79D10|nr:efflux RND transporter periplasmic adaptor subunit [Terracidiphilus gabretensis]